MKVQNESAARKEMEQLQINKLRLTKIKENKDVILIASSLNPMTNYVSDFGQLNSLFNAS